MSSLIHMFRPRIDSSRKISKCAISMKLYSGNSVLNHCLSDVKKCIPFASFKIFEPFFGNAYLLDFLFISSIRVVRKFGSEHFCNCMLNQILIHCFSILRNSKLSQFLSVWDDSSGRISQISSSMILLQGSSLDYV